MGVRSSNSNAPSSTEEVMLIILGPKVCKFRPTWGYLEPQETIYNTSISISLYLYLNIYIYIPISFFLYLQQTAFLSCAQLYLPSRQVDSKPVLLGRESMYRGPNLLDEMHHEIGGHIPYPCKIPIRRISDTTWESLKFRGPNVGPNVF